MSPPLSDAERRAEKLLRRRARLCKASAESLLRSICAVLGPGDLALDLGANVGEVTAAPAASGCDVVVYEPDLWSFERLRARFDDDPEGASVR